MLLHGDGTNGAQNNTFLDSSTNNFTITRNGNTTQGSFSPYGDNWSNYFDGDGDYITVPDNAAFTLGTSNFTIEFLVYPLSGGGTSPIIFEHGQSGDWGAWIFQWISQNEIYFYAASSAGAGSYNVCNQSFGTLAKNQWTHICVTRNGSTFTGYKNGTSVFTSTSALGIQDQTAPVTIGRHYNSTAQDFNGYVSNARIVVGSVITPSAGGPTAPLTAVTNTVLLTCQSNRFIDNSANNFSITAFGTPSVQRFNPFGTSTAYSTSVIGGSGYFDGSGDYLGCGSQSAYAFGTGDFTLNAWFYLTAAPTYMSIADTRSSGWALAIDSGRAIYLYSDAVGFVVTSAVGAVPLNAWTYVTVKRVSGTMTLYLNAVSINSAANSTNFSNTTLTIGANGSGGEPFFGYICDFQAIKGTGTTPTLPTAPLTNVTNTSLLLNYTNGAIFDNAMMNNLETVGAAQISTSVKKYGTGSLYMNASTGDTDYFVQPASQNVNFGTGNFTIEFWLNPLSTDITWANGNLATIMDTDSPAGTGTNWWVVHQQNATIMFASNSAVILLSSSVLTENVWQHVAIVRNGSTVTIYVNGTSAGSTTYATTIGGNRRLTIGTQLGGSRWYKGYIDDIRITKGYARYTSTFTPPTAAFPNIGPV